MASNVYDIGFEPPHPGEFIKEDIMPALGMNVKELAAHLKVSRNTLSKVINGRQSISMEMAQKLGKAFKNGTRFWLTLQMQHDLWVAERKADVDVEPLEWEEPNAA